MHCADRGGDGHQVVVGAGAVRRVHAERDDADVHGPGRVDRIQRRQSAPLGRTPPMLFDVPVPPIPMLK